MHDELAHLDATATAEEVRCGRLSPIEAVEAAIERVEKLNPDVNAVITPLFEAARATAADPPEGPFRGVPFLFKDLLLQTEGDPYHCGTKVLAEHGWRSRVTTHLAVKFREAGLIGLGKTNVPENGTLVTTEPDAYGATRNPWNLDHSVGGSSGGSAAAVACGMVPAAHANDGGGSIRIPASECGLVGLKPSRGRTSLGPEVGESWNGYTVEGAVSRTVRDTAALLDAVAGPMPGDPYSAPPPRRPFLHEVGADPGRLRVGSACTATSTGSTVHPECVTAVERTLKVLDGLGHHVDPGEGPPAFDDPEVSLHYLVVVSASTARDVAVWREWLGTEFPLDRLEPHNRVLAESGSLVTAVQYLESTQWLSRYSRRVARWWADGFDLLVTPTISEPPPRLGEFGPAEDNPAFGLLRAGALVPFTAAFNITGQPAISLPLHWSEDGLPVGVQLVAAYGREDLLLAVSAQLEDAMPWRDRRPPLFAG